MKLENNTPIQTVKDNARTLFDKAGVKRIAPWMKETGNEASEQDRTEILEKMAKAGRRGQDHLQKAMEKQPAFGAINDPNLAQRARDAVTKIIDGSFASKMQLENNTPIQTVKNNAPTLFNNAGVGTIVSWMKETGNEASEQDRTEILEKMEKAGKKGQDHLQKAMEKQPAFGAINDPNLAQRARDAVTKIIDGSLMQAASKMQLENNTPIQTVKDNARTLFRSAGVGTIVSWMKETGNEASEQDRTEILEKMEKAGKKGQDHLSKAMDQQPAFGAINDPNLAQRARDAVTKIIDGSLMQAASKMQLENNTHIQIVKDNARTLFNDAGVGTIVSWMKETGNEASEQDRTEILKKMEKAGKQGRGHLQKAMEKQPAFGAINDPNLAQRARDAVTKIIDGSFASKMQLENNTPIQTVKDNAPTLFDKAGVKRIVPWMKETGNEASEQDRTEILEKMAKAGRRGQDHLQKAMEKQPAFGAINDPNLAQRARDAVTKIIDGSFASKMQLENNTPIQTVKDNAPTLFDKAGVKRIVPWMKETGNEASEQDRTEILEKMAKAGRRGQDHLQKAMEKQPAFGAINDPNLAQRARDAVTKIIDGSLMQAASKIKLDDNTDIQIVKDNAPTLFSDAGVGTIVSWMQETGNEASEQDRTKILEKMAKAGERGQDHLQKAMENQPAFGAINDPNLAQRARDAVTKIIDGSLMQAASKESRKRTLDPENFRQPPAGKRQDQGKGWSR